MIIRRFDRFEMARGVRERHQQQRKVVACPHSTKGDRSRTVCPDALRALSAIARLVNSQTYLFNIIYHMLGGGRQSEK